jgi:hypothetical protein
VFVSECVCLSMPVSVSVSGDDASAGRAEEPSADERSRTCGCGQDPAVHGDEVRIMSSTAV